MHILRKRKPKTSLIVLAIIALVLLAALVIFAQPLFTIFSDPDRARELVTDAGPWGPLVFMAMQIVQVFFAPIPGQVTGFAGGYLFGSVWGTVYTVIGATIGFTLIFILARKLGRPFVEHFVNKKILDKFDYLAKTKGTFILFLIFLLPAFPDDVICYIAGLTSIKIRTLILISLAGRLPGYIALSFTGSGAAEGNMRLVAIMVGVVVILGAIGFWQRARLERFVKRFSERHDGADSNKDSN